MLKTITSLLLGAFMCAGIALAGTGTPPLPNGDEALINQQWLYGLSGGLNETYQYGISAAGSNQAGATQLPSGIALLEIDTSSSSQGVALPFCYQGTEFSIYNNTANTVTVYPNVANNPITAAQDTINNSTSQSLSAHTPYFFGCAKNGVWSWK
jgi:hypothetical protein